MYKRFCDLKRIAAKVLCIVSVAGAVSCADDYKLDDESPSWLGSSIYEYLQTDGNYQNFIKLIDDLDYAEVLSKTGSKTLFVADDDAFKTFYQSNDWGVTSYDQLTNSQKKLLLNSAMINNAYLLEMMSSTSGNPPEKGMCLRRETALAVTDSISHFTGSSLPITYNANDKDYWARFRNGNGIYLALDNTAPMMTHFLAAQMSQNNITDDDFQVIMGVARDKNDAYVYDCKVIEQDITCQNGYINKLDKVLLTPQNMAEVLRTNGQTNIFSHMIDRFSAPFYSETLTRSYNLLSDVQKVDSIFQKRYFSTRSQGNNALDNDANTDPTGNPSGNEVSYALNFDPGWNWYQSNKDTEKEEDMGVIFAPVDSKLYEYFFTNNGGGYFLLEAYAPDYLPAVKGETDYENIYKALDQIPLDVIQALLNNLMKASFNASVPSKFETIKDDAQDPMLDEDDLQYVKGVKIANNGAIYYMDEVLTPARYAAVSAPSYVATDMRVFKYAVEQEDLDIKTNFYAYLLAMSSRFSFFVPQDGFYYIDPVSFAKTKGQQRAYKFDWDSDKSRIVCTTYEYNYDFTTKTGSIGNLISNENLSSSAYLNRLRDMLETHTIVHEENNDVYSFDESATGVECDKKWFISKNGAPIYVKNATQRANGMQVQGGWQNERSEWLDVIRFDDKTAETNGNGNGMAYELTTPIQPTIESVYSVMYNNDDFSDFYELCQADENVIDQITKFNNNGKSATTSEKNKYRIFINNNGLPCYDDETGQQVTSATNVKFFNNYRYTVYIPTNAAVQQAISRGLPTWQDIRDVLYIDDMGEYLPNHPEWTEEEEEAVMTKATAMTTTLINFLKYHFQDNSIFVDTPSLSSTQYETATMNSETGVYCKVTVSGGNNALQVKDLAGNTRNVTTNQNILVRDYVLNSSSNPTQISASSFAVIHGIDGVLDYMNYTNGRYDSNWSSTAKARAYLNKYRIVE